MLPSVPEFDGFTDFCDTFEIFTGDADDDEGQEVIGEFKVRENLLFIKNGHLLSMTHFELEQ